MFCPCCKRPIEELPIGVEDTTLRTQAGEVTLTGNEAVIVGLLWNNFGKTVNHNRISHALWGWEHTEMHYGPMDEVPTAQRVHIHHLRRKLKPLGLVIENVWKTGVKMVAVEKQHEAA